MWNPEQESRQKKPQQIFSVLFSTPVTALVHHWHDLLRPCKLLFFSWSVNTDVGHGLQPPCCCHQSHFSSLPSLRRWCAQLGMQEADRRAAKSYADENWGRFLFVSSPVPCCPPSLFSSGVTFFFPFLFFSLPSLLLESCQQQTPLDGDMQILSLETSQPASKASFELTGDTVWTQKVSIMMQERHQIEPFLSLHKGRDKEAPGCIPRALTCFL